jgi:hypothetical protein
MIKNILFFGLILAFVACKSGEDKPKAESEMTSNDFVDLFKPIESGFVINSAKLASSNLDSFPISSSLIKKFLPDSIFLNDFGKKAKLKFFSLGRKKDNNKNDFILIKVSSINRKFVYLFVFDKEQNYKAGIPLVSIPGENKTQTEAGIDKKFAITINNFKSASDGQSYFTKNVFAYDNEGFFTLILRESNEIPANQEVYNPIDSLPKKHKLTGDYRKNKKNFLSLRDGSKPNKLLFFIHFESENGRCSGELKGEAELVKANKLIYSAAGDPCSIEFNFSGSQVNFQELKGCGNYRGIKCSFEGTFTKVKSKKK